MCGDSIVVMDVEILVGEDWIDMCWIDLFYNVNYEGIVGKIENDNMDGDVFFVFLIDVFVIVFFVMKKGVVIYVVYVDIEGLLFCMVFMFVGFKFLGCLVWVKLSFVFGCLDYQWWYEFIFYGWKSGVVYCWYGGWKQIMVVDVLDMLFILVEDGVFLIDIGFGYIRVIGDDMKVEELKFLVLYYEKFV